MGSEVLFRDLGTMDYRPCRELQLQLFERALEAKRSGREVEPTVLLVEHRPVYTLGHNGKAENLLVGKEFLASRGAELVPIERGGDITFHGPGQLVCYPIVDLEQFRLGLRQYIEVLERTVIEVVAAWGIKGEILTDAPGVWVTDQSPVRKVCAIGVKCSRFVTMHGFALNVTTDLEWFDLINPCGFTDRGATSIERELARRGERLDDKAALMTQVKALVAERLKENINVNK